jgi:hypothetical protein
MWGFQEADLDFQRQAKKATVMTLKILITQIQFVGDLVVSLDAFSWGSLLSVGGPIFSGLDF